MDLKIDRARQRDALIRLLAVLGLAGGSVFLFQSLWPSGSPIIGAIVLAAVAAIGGVAWMAFERSTVKLDGSVVRRRFVTTSEEDLDRLRAVRVIGDTNASVVLQGTFEGTSDSFVLPLLRRERSVGMYALSADAFDALARTIDVYDIRDHHDEDWPTNGAGGSIERARKAAHVIGTGVSGRHEVARLLREQALYMRDGADLSRSPLAAHLFTSNLIATNMARASVSTAIDTAD